MAEEVTQDVFLALIRQTKHYDQSRGSLAAYLCGIARNLTRLQFKRDRRHVSLADEENTAEIAKEAVSQQDVLGDLTSQERLAALHQAILTLPLHYREVIVLCHLQGLSLSEAASALGCPEGTVRSRMSRARLLLTEKLRVVEHV